MPTISKDCRYISPPASKRPTAA
ncbi:hypothetical protein [Paraburkholderia sp. CHISQ3]